MCCHRWCRERRKEQELGKSGDVAGIGLTGREGVGLDLKRKLARSLLKQQLIETRRKHQETRRGRSFIDASFYFKERDVSSLARSRCLRCICSLTDDAPESRTSPHTRDGLCSIRSLPRLCGQDFSSVKGCCPERSQDLACFIYWPVSSAAKPPQKRGARLSRPITVSSFRSINGQASATRAGPIHSKIKSDFPLWM